MPTSDLGDLRHTQTSPGGTARRSGLATAIAAIVLVAPSLEPATANTYELPSFFVRTASGPDGQIVPVPSESTGEAVLEIRRRSGLTWEQLGHLFDVSRRSVHHWASGKAVTPEHERMLRWMLASIRRLDQGSQAATRARLLAVDERFGVTVLDLLKEGRFGEAGGQTDGKRSPGYRPIPLSREARDARRPQAPALLLEADQERPDIPAKARTVDAVRAPKKMG